jgi:hypothetical protein
LEEIEMVESELKKIKQGLDDRLLRMEDQTAMLCQLRREKNEYS